MGGVRLTGGGIIHLTGKGTSTRGGGVRLTGGESTSNKGQFQCFFRSNSHFYSVRGAIYLLVDEVFNHKVSNAILADYVICTHSIQ